MRRCVAPAVLTRPCPGTAAGVALCVSWRPFRYCPAARSQGHRSSTTLPSTTSPAAFRAATASCAGEGAAAEPLARQQETLEALHTLLAKNLNDTAKLMKLASLPRAEENSLRLLSHLGFSIDEEPDVPALAADVLKPLAKLVSPPEPTTGEARTVLTEEQEELRSAIRELLKGLVVPESPAVRAQRMIREYAGKPGIIVMIGGKPVTRVAESQLATLVVGCALQRLIIADTPVEFDDRVDFAESELIVGPAAVMWGQPAAGDTRSNHASRHTELFATSLVVFLGDSGIGKTFATMQLGSLTESDVTIVYPADAELAGRVERATHSSVSVALAKGGSAEGDQRSPSALEKELNQDLGGADSKCTEREAIHARQILRAEALAEFIAGRVKERLNQCFELSAFPVAKGDDRPIRVTFVVDEIGSLPLVVGTLATCMPQMNDVLVRKLGAGVEVQIIAAGTGSMLPEDIKRSNHANFCSCVLRPLSESSCRTLLGKSCFSEIVGSTSPARAAALALASNPRGALLLVASWRGVRNPIRTLLATAHVSIPFEFELGLPDSGGDAEPAHQSCTLRQHRCATDEIIGTVVLAAAAGFRLLNGLAHRSIEKRLELLAMALYVSECYAAGAAEHILVREKEWKDELVASTGLLSPTSPMGHQSEGGGPTPLAAGVAGSTDREAWVLPPAQGVVLVAGGQAPWFESGWEAAEAAVAAGLLLKLKALLRLRLRDDREAATLQTQYLRLLLRSTGQPVAGADCREVVAGRQAAPFTDVVWLESTKRRFGRLPQGKESAEQQRARLQEDWDELQRELRDVLAGGGAAAGDRAHTTAVVIQNAPKAPAADLFLIVPSLKVAYAIQVKACAASSLANLSSGLEEEVDKMRQLKVALGDAYDARMTLCLINAPSSGSAPDGDATSTTDRIASIRSHLKTLGCELALVGFDDNAGGNAPASLVWPATVPLAT